MERLSSSLEENISQLSLHEHDSQQRRTGSKSSILNNSSTSLFSSHSQLPFLGSSSFAGQQSPSTATASSSHVSVTFAEFQRRDFHFSLQYHYLNLLNQAVENVKSDYLEVEGSSGSTPDFNAGQHSKLWTDSFSGAGKLPSGQQGKSMSLGSSRKKGNSGGASGTSSWTRAKSNYQMDSTILINTHNFLFIFRQNVTKIRRGLIPFDTDRQQSFFVTAVAQQAKAAYIEQFISR